MCVYVLKRNCQTDAPSIAKKKIGGLRHSWGVSHSTSVPGHWWGVRGEREVKCQLLSQQNRLGQRFACEVTSARDVRSLCRHTALLLQPNSHCPPSAWTINLPWVEPSLSGFHVCGFIFLWIRGRSYGELIPSSQIRHSSASVSVSNKTLAFVRAHVEENRTLEWDSPISRECVHGLNTWKTSGSRRLKQTR